jgi:hypothetical protein
MARYEVSDRDQEGSTARMANELEKDEPPVG